MRTRILWTLIAVAACGGNDLQVGHDMAGSQLANGSGAASGAGGSSGTGATSDTLHAWPAQEGCPTDPGLEGLLGTWEGNLEDFFLQPIEQLRVVINGASAAGFCGTVTWGTRDAPPPADDATAAYPSNEYWDAHGLGGGPNLPPIEGFPYSIAEGGERLPTLRLGVAASEPWRSWCELQTPVLSQQQGRWECTNPPNGCDAENFQCMACSSSARLCACDEAACTAVAQRPDVFDLTLSEDGAALTGTFTTTSPTPWPYTDPAPTIYLERQP